VESKPKVSVNEFDFKHDYNKKGQYDSDPSGVRRKKIWRRERGNPARGALQPKQGSSLEIRYRRCDEGKWGGELNYWSPNHQVTHKLELKGKKKRGGR